MLNIKENLNVFQIIVILLLITAIVWFLLPATSLIFHVGMVYPPIILAIIAFFVARPNSFKKLLDSHKAITITFTTLFVVGVIAVVSIIGIMISASNVAPKGNTVIVLGCQVNGKEPSLMLEQRMKVALEYLNENPESVCVASGAKGPGEEISEAQAIKDYLLSNGIQEKRIYLEYKSTNTQENIKYSSAVIKKEGLDKNIVVATDSFHELRAKILAQKCSLEFSAKPCSTVWYLCPSYWTREVVAVVKDLAINL